MVHATRCVSCGAEVVSRFCPDCGEAAGHHDYSLTHFGEELLEAFAHVDGRVVASFRSLVRWPGLLASSFLAGRRRSQMGPVQMFVVCNVIYFLVQPLTAFSTFTSTLGIQTGPRPWGGLARSMTEARMAARRVPIEEYARRFNEVAHLQGKSLVIVMVPLFAFGTWALYGRRRRFYAEHLVFAFYFFAALMLWMAFSTLVLTRPVRFAVAEHWSDGLIENVVSALISLPLVIYLFAAVRRAYAESFWHSVSKTLLLAGWLAAVLTVYRFILFFSTFYAT